MSFLTLARVLTLGNQCSVVSVTRNPLHNVSKKNFDDHMNFWILIFLKEDSQFAKWHLGDVKIPK